MDRSERVQAWSATNPPRPCSGACPWGGGDPVVASASGGLHAAATFRAALRAGGDYLSLVSLVLLVRDADVFFAIYVGRGKEEYGLRQGSAKFTQGGVREFGAVADPDRNQVGESFEAVHIFQGGATAKGHGHK